MYTMEYIVFVYSPSFICTFSINVDIAKIQTHETLTAIQYYFLFGYVKRGIRAHCFDITRVLLSRKRR